MKLILDLLTEGFELNVGALYVALNKKPVNILDTSNDSRGLGKVFQLPTRKNYKGAADVNLAFTIDDRTVDAKGQPKKPTAQIKDLKALYKLAQVFKTGDKAQKISADKRKYALCLALIIHSLQKNVNPEYVKELTQVYSGLILPSSMDKAIKAKLDQMQVTLDKPLTVVEKMLFDMGEVKVSGGIKKQKEAQQKHFNAEIKKFTVPHLRELANYMSKVPDMQKADEKYFGVIRQERISLFGNGNTNTWQAMVLAVKVELMTKLGAPNTVVGKMLTEMSKIKVEGDVKKTKEEQKFEANIKELKEDELTVLAEYMGIAQDLTQLGFKNDHFDIIRQERYSLFGSGNTDTWQAMFTAAKTELLDKMGAPVPAKETAKEPVKDAAKEPAKETAKQPAKDAAKEPAKDAAKETAKEPVKVELSAEKHALINGLLSKHSGRFYATLFATNSSTLFNASFKAAEAKAKEKAQQAVLPSEPTSTLPTPLRTAPTASAA